MWEREEPKKQKQKHKSKFWLAWQTLPCTDFKHSSQTTQVLPALKMKMQLNVAPTLRMGDGGEEAR